MNPHHLLPERPFATYREYLDATGRAESVVLTARDMGAARVLEEVAASGLRGRGGAGFPTARKWSSVREHPCDTRYVVCNAAEGEPGTFKDRYLLRKNPYAMLEGLLVAADVVGAREAIVAMKASFEPEVARVRGAIRELEAEGLLGYHELRVALGPEEYLFGEEKALLEVVEGNEPLPREPHYPPYERGLFAKPGSPNPAVVNNVETLAHVPSIVAHGGTSFRTLGTADTPGTMLFTVSGDVQRPGVYELPAGIVLRELFERVAGGPRPGRRFKAALAGVSAAPILPEHFDVRADFGSMAPIAGLGSAGFVLVDDATSMVRVLQAIARFLYVESCNQCSACKAGLRIASSGIDDLFDPRLASPDDVPRAIQGAKSAPQGNRCFLPVQGSIVLPALFEHFGAEVDAQIAQPAGAPAEWIIPKMVDFDEATRTFRYDLAQPRKKPDWTFEEGTTGPTSRRRDRLAGY